MARAMARGNGKGNGKGNQKRKWESTNNSIGSTDKPCFFHFKNGSCKKGHLCNFSHQDADEQTVTFRAGPFQNALKTFTTMSNGSSSSDGGQLTIEDITAQSEPQAKVMKQGEQDTPGQIFLANLQQSMQSYRTVVTDAERVERMMKDASADGRLSPLEQDLIDSLFGGDGRAHTFMLRLHPDLTDESHQALDPGTNLRLGRTPWSQPFNRVVIDSDPEARMMMMPCLMTGLELGLEQEVTDQRCQCCITTANISRRPSFGRLPTETISSEMLNLRRASSVERCEESMHSWVPHSRIH